MGRADASVQFVKTPLAGVDGDNIYSVPHTGYSLPFDWRISTGMYPGTEQANFGCPGYLAISLERHSSTDTVLIP